MTLFSKVTIKKIPPQTIIAANRQHRKIAKAVTVTDRMTQYLQIAYII